MRSRMVWRNSREVPALWQRCPYRGLLLYEDEIRSVEGQASAATLLPPRLRKHVTTAQIVS